MFRDSFFTLASLFSVISSLQASAGQVTFGDYLTMVLFQDRLGAIQSYSRFENNPAVLRWTNPWMTFDLSLGLMRFTGSLISILRSRSYNSSSNPRTRVHILLCMARPMDPCVYWDLRAELMEWQTFCRVLRISDIPNLFFSPLSKMAPRPFINKSTITP
jgi:hypothetical protein